jgi:glutamate racemase
MRGQEDQENLRMTRDSPAEVRLVVTDSGLGGLLICAEIERRMRAAGAPNAHITYFNAWPEEDRGYNALPDAASRAAVFDRALRRINELRPDRIVIACNTLSILYPITEHGRAAGVPVIGIIDAGVDLFHQALTADPGAAIVILGTRTTVESDVHRRRLTGKGIVAARIAAVSCHGLAAAIDKDPESPETAGLVRKCAQDAGAMRLPGERLYAGLCCTHYSYVADPLCAALAAQSGREVRVLDPKQGLVNAVAPPGPPRIGPAPEIAVEVISKVALSASQREALARRIVPVSALTARALLSYTRMADLF